MTSLLVKRKFITQACQGSCS